MIFVCQGHESSIGLEVFLKSFILLSSEEQAIFKLVANKNSIEKTLESLKIKYTITETHLRVNEAVLQVEFFKPSELPQSTTSLIRCLEQLNHHKDILLTLPTSKDQLIDNNVTRAGYTEFLRNRYQTMNTAMVFSAEAAHYLLVTDHIPLIKVAQVICSELIVQKTSNTIEGYRKYFHDFDEVILAGINPHVGENGILGDEDVAVFDAKEKLQKIYPSISFKGPFSGDTLHFHDRNVRQLKVYMYHDQGLPVFKALNGTIGLNISLGLPFLRMSVDHGTAFDLYQKNCADYQGALYLLKKGIEAHKRING